MGMDAYTKTRRMSDAMLKKMKLEGRALRKWAGINGEMPTRVATVIHGYVENEEIKAKLVRDGLWDALRKKPKRGYYPELKTPYQQSLKFNEGGSK